jgi:hypothetical protein
VDGEKYVKDFSESDGRGIERNPHNLNMSGIAAADLPVCWIVNVAAHIARFNRCDAFHAVKHRFQAPETSTA